MKNTHALIIVLLVANLIATFWFGITSESANPIQDREEITLPSYINRDVRDRIYKRFITAYNNKNYEAMYDLFSSAAKAQIDKSETIETGHQLVDYFDSIVEGGYSHSQYLGAQGDLTQFKLVYAVKFSEKSKFGTSGKLSITLALRDNEYEIWGFNLQSS
jgi:hypothetical protein